MQLHQFQIAFDAIEDRLLMRVSFKDGDQGLQEVRAWLTRRMVGNMWPRMLEALETQVMLDNPGAASARDAIVGMQHEASMQAMQEGGNFAQPYEAEATAHPLGEAPLLISQVKFSMGAGQPLRAEFGREDGQAFEVAVPATLFHGYCKLLRDAAIQADWGLELREPGAPATAGGPDELPRVLN